MLLKRIERDKNHNCYFKSLKLIQDVWANMELSVTLHNDEGVYRIKASDEISQMLEDHLAQLYSMKGSKYVNL